MEKAKTKKFNIKKFIIFVIILIVILLTLLYLFKARVRNIIILNNNYYTDEEIIEAAKIENYPKFLLLSTSRIRNRILKLDLVEDVKVSKKFGFIVKIDVTEKKLLYYIRSKQEYMASNYKTYKLDDVLGKPTLINYVPENIEKSFVKEFSKLDNNIIDLISEIEYSKTNYDEKRFLFYMNDGNEVYITISRIELMNKYIDIVKKLSNKNGILYLDSGNYFEIKK